MTMASWGEVAALIDEEAFAAKIGAKFVARHFRTMRKSRIHHFETTRPQGRREQVRWLRAMAKIACLEPPADDLEAMQRVWFRWMCQFAMFAIHVRLPDAPHRIRAAALSVDKYAPRCASAHAIAKRLLESLGPSGVAA